MPCAYSGTKATVYLWGVNLIIGDGQVTSAMNADLNTWVPPGPHVPHSVGNAHRPLDEQMCIGRLHIALVSTRPKCKKDDSGTRFAHRVSRPNVVDGVSWYVVQSRVLDVDQGGTL